MKRITLAIAIFLSSFSHARDLNIWNDFTSPVTTDAKYITLGGLTATAMVFANKDFRTYRKRESFDDARPFGNYGFIGEYLGYGFLNAVYTLTAYYYGTQTGEEKYFQAAEHMAKASLYSSGLTLVLKTAINERRPGYPDDSNSFPSGHSSASFAFASVIAARHGWYWGGLAYGTATFVALSRINDDFHYLHDVLFGMTIGAAYGWGIYNNYKNGAPYFLTAIPLDGGAGVTFAMEF